jgi:ABC-type multidrug transport system permease subunit
MNPSFKRLVENSVRLTFAYPLRSLGVLAATALTVAISFLLPRGIFVVATASVCVWIINLGTWRVIRRHLPQELLDTL